MQHGFPERPEPILNEATSYGFFNLQNVFSINFDPLNKDLNLGFPLPGINWR